MTTLDSAGFIAVDDEGLGGDDGHDGRGGGSEWRQHTRHRSRAGREDRRTQADSRLEGCAYLGGRCGESADTEVCAVTASHILKVGISGKFYEFFKYSATLRE